MSPKTEKSEDLSLLSTSTNKGGQLSRRAINQKAEEWGTHLVVVVHAGEVPPAFVPSDFNEALEKRELLL